MALFEGYERKIDKINGVLTQYSLESVEACRDICTAKGLTPTKLLRAFSPSLLRTLPGLTALALPSH